MTSLQLSSALGGTLLLCALLHACVRMWRRAKQWRKEKEVSRFEVCHLKSATRKNREQLIALLAEDERDESADGSTHFWPKRDVILADFDAQRPSFWLARERGCESACAFAWGEPTFEDSTRSSVVFAVIALFVSPRKRRQGVGMQLVAALRDAAREARCAAVRGDVQENSTSARAFWCAAGFRAIASGGGYQTWHFSLASQA